MRIFKYILTISSKQTIEIPRGFRILSVQNQNNNITLWCLIDDENGPTDVNFRIYATGQSCGMSVENYIGTVQMNNGLVWHIFKED